MGSSEEVRSAQTFPVVHHSVRMVSMAAGLGLPVFFHCGFGLNYPGHSAACSADTQVHLLPGRGW